MLNSTDVKETTVRKPTDNKLIHIALLKQIQQGGDTGIEAYYQLAYYYTFGLRGTILINYKLAFPLLEKASKNGHMCATALLATEYYWNGKDNRQDKGKAKKLIASIALDLINTVVILKKDAPHARYYLAYCYEKGIFVEKKQQTAIKLYQQESRTNNPLAQNRLSYCYREGIGTVVNLFEAFNWCKRASTTLSTAIYNFGYFHEKGIDVEIDRDKSFKYYKEAVDEYGHVSAKYRLARCYKHGYGTKLNLDKVFELNLEAAEQGYELAERRVARFYENGELVDKDHKKAFAWIYKAAQKKLSSNSISCLGYYYRHSIGTEKDLDKSFKCCKEALKLDPKDTVALQHMGMCYQHGMGVHTNLSIALKYFRRVRPFPYNDYILLSNQIYQYYDDFHTAVNNEKQNILVVYNTISELINDFRVPSCVLSEEFKMHLSKKIQSSTRTEDEKNSLLQLLAIRGCADDILMDCKNYPGVDALNGGNKKKNALTYEQLYVAKYSAAFFLNKYITSNDLLKLIMNFLSIDVTLGTTFLFFNLYKNDNNTSHEIQKPQDPTAN